MRFLLIFLSVILITDTVAQDKEGIVKGKVFDFVSGEKLVGANIVYAQLKGGISGKDGEYIVSTTAGNVTISFQYIGYKSETRSIYLHSNDTIELNVGLLQEINQIDQIVISGSRTEQKLSESTVSLSIILPDVLEKNHIVDAEELINKTPGIEVLDGQASIRGGSGFSYGAGSRVLALIDGMPVVAADAGNIRWQFLPLENLSQIEIIKGAASVLYGSSALNGVINFRTANAGFKPVTRFYAEGGLYDKPSQKDWVWSDKIRFSTATSLSHLQKIGNNDFGFSLSTLTDDGYRRLNDEKLGRFGLTFKHFNKKVQGLEYGLNLNSGITVKRDFLLWENAETGALRQDETTVLQLHGRFLTLDPSISLKKTNTYRQDLRMRIQSSVNSYPDNPNNNSDALSWFAEYQSWYKITEFLNLSFGLSQTASRIISNFYGDHDGQNIAALTQLDFKLLERIKLTTGVRFEYNSLDGIDDRIVPVFRAGVNYVAAKYTFLRASFGQGYRYPSIAEKHAYTSLGAVRIFPNPYVNPESGWNTELGIKQGIKIGESKGQADLAVFYSQNKDMIEYEFGRYPDPLTGSFFNGFRAINIEQSRVYGIETEFLINYHFGKLNTNITGGYIFMYPTAFNPVSGSNIDTYLKYRRKHSVKLSISASYNKFEFGLDAFAKSKILNIDGVFLEPDTREVILPGFFDYWNANNKAYFLADANAGYNFNEKYSISLVVRNLTNTEYMGRPGDIRPPRSFGLRFSAKL